MRHVCKVLLIAAILVSLVRAGPLAEKTEAEVADEGYLSSVMDKVDFGRMFQALRGYPGDPGDKGRTGDKGEVGEQGDAGDYYGG